MVDVEKSNGNKDKKPRNSNLPEIDLKSLIFGAAIYAFFPLVAYQNNIDVLIAFAAIGPIYIGYEARTNIKSIILGIIGGTPLVYLSFMGYLGTYTATEQADLIISIIVLGLSAVMSWFGAHLYQSRAKAKAEYEYVNKGTKNVQPQRKKKFEDTGSVSQNIINLFKPRRKQ